MDREQSVDTRQDNLKLIEKIKYTVTEDLIKADKCSIHETYQIKIDWTMW